LSEAQTDGWLDQIRPLASEYFIYLGEYSYFRTEMMVATFSVATVLFSSLKHYSISSAQLMKLHWCGFAVI